MKYLIEYDLKNDKKTSCYRLTPTLKLLLIYKRLIVNLLRNFTGFLEFSFIGFNGSKYGIRPSPSYRVSISGEGKITL